MNPSASTRSISVSPFSAERVASRSCPCGSKTQPVMRSVFLRRSVRSPVEMLHLVEIVPRLIAIVEPDVDRVRVGLGHGVDHGAHAFAPRSDCAPRAPPARRPAEAAGSTAYTLKFSSPP